MKLLFIHHSSDDRLAKMEELVNNTKTHNITIEIVSDCDVMQGLPCASYDAVLIDYTTVPYAFITKSAATIFADSLVLVLYETAQAQHVNQLFDSHRLDNMRLATHDPEEILNLVCLECELPRITDSVKLVIAKLTLIEEELRNYVNTNTKT